MSVNIVAYGQARAAYYDRNPTTQSTGSAFAAAAPHASTVRWTYTVPTNRKFFVGAMTMWAIINALLDAGANLQLYVSVSGANPHFLISRNAAPAGDVLSLAVAGGGNLLAGQVLSSTSALTGVGGSVSFTTGFQGVEFDA